MSMLPMNSKPIAQNIYKLHSTRTSILYLKKSFEHKTYDNFYFA